VSSAPSLLTDRNVSPHVSFLRYVLVMMPRISSKMRALRAFRQFEPGANLKRHPFIDAYRRARGDRIVVALSLSSLAGANALERDPFRGR